MSEKQQLLQALSCGGMTDCLPGISLGDPKGAAVVHLLSWREMCNIRELGQFGALFETSN